MRSSTRSASTYQAKDVRREMSLLEEWHGDFTSNDAEIGSIRSLEKLVENALFLRREIEVRVSLC
jgi:hypothetical protein